MEKLLTAFVCLLALTQVRGLEVNEFGRINITVVTTAGCINAVNFIRTQLYPVYNLYGGRFIGLEFIPWGRSTWDGVGSIGCQFGVNDCWANRLHRCVLDFLKDDQDRQMEYMFCEFEQPRPSFVWGTYECARAAGLNLLELDHCVANNHDDLDRAAQIAAAEPMRVINFIPAVVFNGEPNAEMSTQARANLARLICTALSADSRSGITSCGDL